jgi:hypothetical protein
MMRFTFFNSAPVFCDNNKICLIHLNLPNNKSEVLGPRSYLLLCMSENYS